MNTFNLSALAVRERAITLFLMLALLIAGGYSFLKLGRSEDPQFSIKVMSISAMWPGATALEMQEQVGDVLEKRLQELEYYDRVETLTRPGFLLMTLVLNDSMPPKELPQQFYQTRKKISDEANSLPKG